MRKLLNEELKRLSVESFKDSVKLPLVVILDNVRSLNNIGSVFRTSDAFRVEAIYLCGITATPPHKDIHKTALGATESVKWEYFERSLDAMNELKTDGYEVCAIEQTVESVMLEKFPIEKGKKYALIFGHEMRGVDQEVVDASDQSIEIPQFGTKHSLNISVSAGVVLWEFYRKMGGIINP
jgi:23S rRNA (guanosine2251-2'-O)-methyltransferase